MLKAAKPRLLSSSGTSCRVSAVMRMATALFIFIRPFESAVCLRRTGAIVGAASLRERRASGPRAAGSRTTAATFCHLFKKQRRDSVSSQFCCFRVVFAYICFLLRSRTAFHTSEIRATAEMLEVSLFSIFYVSLLFPALVSPNQLSVSHSSSRQIKTLTACVCGGGDKQAVIFKHPLHYN